MIIKEREESCNEEGWEKIKNKVNKCCLQMRVSKESGMIRGGRGKKPNCYDTFRLKSQIVICHKRREEEISRKMEQQNELSNTLNIRA